MAKTISKKRGTLEDLKNKRKVAAAKYATEPETTEPIEEDKVHCIHCGRDLKKSNFYKSSNPAHRTGVTPFCKDCWFSLCANSIGEVDKEKFKHLLMQNDKPYFDDAFIAAFREHKTPRGLVGTYMKRIALQQYRDLTWKDSVFEAPKEAYKSKKKGGCLAEQYDLDELEDIWGMGFTVEELVAFEKRYRYLTKTNPPINPIHDDAIKTYVRYRVKADLCTSQNDVSSASKWAAMAEKQQAAALLSPDKLSKSELSNGVSDFASLTKEIEAAVNGVIPLLPTVLEAPRDQADFILYAYVCYNRQLRGLPPCEYREIYEFYDRRMEEVTFAETEEEDEYDQLD